MRFIFLYINIGVQDPFECIASPKPRDLGVTLRRQDFGRRRALGASRTAIISLVAAQNLLVAIAGAGVGATAGAFLVWRWTGSTPRPFFTLAVAVLAILASLAAALPPALVAAMRDPVRVLRVP